MWTLKSGPGRIWGGGRPIGPTPLATGLTNPLTKHPLEDISARYCKSSVITYNLQSGQIKSEPFIGTKTLYIACINGIVSTCAKIRRSETLT